MEKKRYVHNGIGTLRPFVYGRLDLPHFAKVQDERKAGVAF